MLNNPRIYVFKRPQPDATLIRSPLLSPHATIQLKSRHAICHLSCRSSSRLGRCRSGGRQTEALSPSLSLASGSNRRTGWVVRRLTCDCPRRGLWHRQISRVSAMEHPFAGLEHRRSPSAQIQDPKQRSKRAMRPRVAGQLHRTESAEPCMVGKWDHGTARVTRHPDTGSTYTGEAQMVGPDTIELRGYILLPLFGRTSVLGS